MQVFHSPDAPYTKGISTEDIGRVHAPPACSYLNYAKCRVRFPVFERYYKIINSTSPSARANATCDKYALGAALLCKNKISMRRRWTFPLFPQPLLLTAGAYVCAARGNLHKAESAGEAEVSKVYTGNTFESLRTCTFKFRFGMREI